MYRRMKFYVRSDRQERIDLDQFPFVDLHAVGLTMARDLTQLVNHLDGLIVLADLAWWGPPRKYAETACSFRRLSQTYQDAALAQRERIPK
jgi:hypothetical protein